LPIFSCNKIKIKNRSLFVIKERFNEEFTVDLFARTRYLDKEGWVSAIADLNEYLCIKQPKANSNMLPSFSLSLFLLFPLFDNLHFT